MSTNDHRKQESRPGVDGSPTGALTNGSGSNRTDAKYNAEWARELLAPYRPSAPDSGGNIRIICPFDHDTTGDLSVHPAENMYHCFSCDASGTADDLLTYLKGKEPPAWLSEASSRNGRRRSTSPRSGDRPIPSHELVEAWHKRLLDEANSDKLEQLMADRGISLDTIKRFKIGWGHLDGPGGYYFYSIPIYNRLGEIVDVRRYRPNRTPKITCWPGAHHHLYPWSILDDAEGELALCEGDFDAMVLNQSGIPAVTSTGGATSWNGKAWNPVLRGRVGPVLYDNDKAGRKGRQKPLAGLRESFPVDLPVKDVTDWFRDGRTANELRELIEGARSVVEDDPILEDDDEILEDDSERPTINVSGDLNVLVEQATDALVLSNQEQEPRIFRRGDILIRVVNVDDKIVTDAFGRDTFRKKLAEVARWVAIKTTKDEQYEVEVRPDEHVIGYLLNKKEYPELPALDRLVTAPVLAPDGSFIMNPGYHAASRTLYVPSKGMDKMKPLPAKVTREHIMAALAYLDKPLGFHHGKGFPFASEADYANALSLLLLPFARECISGPTPLYLAEAPDTRTGKGKLITVLLFPAIGQFETVPEKGSSDEYRKEITAQLIESPNAIVFDNIKGRLGGSALEAAITAEIWTERVLGVSRKMNARVRNIWAATSNNAQITLDMAGRTVLIRLDADMERPGERKASDFAIPNVERWVRDHRSNMVRCALLLCKAWVQEGRPKGSADSGDFQDYADVMSGILDVAGVPGFLGNKTRVYEKVEEAEEEVAGLFAAWYVLFQSDPKTTSQVAELISSGHGGQLAASLPVELNQVMHMSKMLSRKLGVIMRSYEGKVRGGYKLVKAGWAADHVTKWQINKVDGGR